ncbi:MAG: hemolysin XhlA family protein [Ectobacillus sp.]
METPEYQEQGIKIIQVEQKDLLQDVCELEKKVAAIEKDMEIMKKDITRIMNNTTWILRVIIGAVIAALIEVFINKGL